MYVGAPDKVRGSSPLVDDTAMNGRIERCERPVQIAFATRHHGTRRQPNRRRLCATQWRGGTGPTCQHGKIGIVQYRLLRGRLNCNLPQLNEMHFRNMQLRRRYAALLDQPLQVVIERCCGGSYVGKPQ
jgi:hypothetical protein